ncbi:MAG: SulP family inorganic anion transporter [Actinomycetota bacterium]|nr:SulP family inorganic anion transporter [Actinomycetota bacterium]
MLKIRSIFRKETLKDDAVAGLVLGVESVPDGLAGGLLAGVNPVYGLYAYMVGTFTGGLFTSSSFMAVQATGAMAIVVADVGAVHSADDPARALFTLSIVTGVVMLAAGLLKAGSILRFVSNAVMVGFINAVGINIILGQLDNFTGYEAVGANRVLRAFDTLFNLGSASWPTVTVGVATIGLILVLERTKLGALGMVVAIIAGSAIAPLLGWDVAILNDIAEIPRSLPLPMMPQFGLIPALLIPALSLAFIGLVQGAGISANFPNPDGTYPDASRDFVGQGAANVAVGIFQGMPVGGSMSASSLVKSAGAKSRLALLIAGVVMAIVILIFGSVVGYVAMPALAGLLMTVGYRTVKPLDIKAVWKTGKMQATVMTVTFVLTMVIPLQYAVLIGVGISMILYIIKQSNQIVIKRWLVSEDGDLREVDPPVDVPAHEVVLLQPYGSLFFASAPVFEEKLPDVTDETHNSVVVLRLRGRTDLGSTFMDVLLRYAEALRDRDSKLVLVSASENIHEQLAVARVTSVVGSQNIYTSDEWVGRTFKQAYRDASEWVEAHEGDEDETSSPQPAGDD